MRNIYRKEYCYMLRRRGHLAGKLLKSRDCPDERRFRAVLAEYTETVSELQRCRDRLRSQ